MKLGIIGYGMIVKEFFDFCYQQLEKSLAVSRIQTTARKKAGIIFPVD